MARPRGVVLDDSHRQRVADGDATLAEIAAELGIERQAAWATFKRRGWATTPQPAAIQSETATNNSSPPAAPAKGKPTRRRQRSACTQQAASADPLSTSPAGALDAMSDNLNADRQAKQTVPPAPQETSGEDLTEAVRQELTNIGLLALGHARSLLGREVISPNSLKAILASTVLSIEMLAKSGFDVDARLAGDETPEMIISTYTVEEMAAIQREAEAEYHGIALDPDPDDEDSD